MRNTMFYLTVFPVELLVGSDMLRKNPFWQGLSLEINL